MRHDRFAPSPPGDRRRGGSCRPRSSAMLRERVTRSPEEGGRRSAGEGAGTGAPRRAAWRGGAPRRGRGRSGARGRGLRGRRAPGAGGAQENLALPAPRSRPLRPTSTGPGRSRSPPAAPGPRGSMRRPARASGLPAAASTKRPSRRPARPSPARRAPGASSSPRSTAPAGTPRPAPSGPKASGPSLSRPPGRSRSPPRPSGAPPTSPSSASPPTPLPRSPPASPRDASLPMPAPSASKTRQASTGSPHGWPRSDQPPIVSSVGSALGRPRRDRREGGRRPVAVLPGLEPEPHAGLLSQRLMRLTPGGASWDWRGVIHPGELEEVLDGEGDRAAGGSRG